MSFNVCQSFSDDSADILLLVFMRLSVLPLIALLAATKGRPPDTALPAPKDGGDDNNASVNEGRDGNGRKKRSLWRRVSSCFGIGYVEGVLVLTCLVVVFFGVIAVCVRVSMCVSIHTSMPICLSIGMCVRLYARAYVIRVLHELICASCFSGFCVTRGGTRRNRTPALSKKESTTQISFRDRHTQ